MIFKIILGLNKILPNSNIRFREGVRAVIFNDRKQILLMRTNKGDLKLPGGGIKANESHKEALIREIQEETGYQTVKLSEQIGYAIEQFVDNYDEKAYFAMKSYYYLAEISEACGQQNLDDYEKEQEFVPIFMDIKDAIAQNEIVMIHRCFNSNAIIQNPWVYRETMVMKELLQWQEKSKNTDDEKFILKTI